MAEVTPKEPTSLVKQYYADYAKYVLETRALPSIIDGLKLSQRRLVYVASKSGMSFTKSSKILGNTIPYHPHSLDSLYGVLVNLTTNMNRYRLFKGKGNWGGVGFKAAAYRYTEAYLDELARFTYTQLIDYADFHEGESGLEEPVNLPALIPYSLLTGAQGIGVGLSVRIMPLDSLGLIDYYISILRGEEPKTPNPDLGNYILDMDDKDIDNSVENYWGRVRIRSILTRESDKILVIDDLYNRNIYTLVNKLGEWINNGLVDFRDETTIYPRYVFEIVDDRISMDELEERIADLTTVKKSFTRLVVDDKVAKYVPLRYQVERSLEYLSKVVDKKFDNEIEKLTYNEQVLLAIQRMREEDIIKEIPNLTMLQLKRKVRELGFEDRVVSAAISKSISYLTKSHDQELRDIRKHLREIKKTDRREYILNLYLELRKKIEPIYNQSKHSVRRSQLLTKHGFELVDGNKLRISESGEPYDNCIYVIYKEGYGRKLQVGTSVRHDIPLEEPENIVGIVSDRYELIGFLTNYGSAVTVNRNRLDGRNLLRLWEDEYVADIYYCNPTSEHEAPVKIEGKEHNAWDYFRTRYATPVKLKKRK